MRDEPRPKVVVCPRCGQRGDEPPGLKLSEFDRLGAVFVPNDDFTDTQSVPLPQKLTCRSCGRSWAVARGAIEVRKP